MTHKKLVIAAFLGCLAVAGLLTFSVRKMVHSNGTTQHHCCGCGHDHSTATEAQPYNVIFDLNGVLFNINRRKALSQLGFFDILSYLATGNSVHDLEKTMFDVLDQLEPARPVYGDALIPLHRDRPIPQIMQAWFKGDISGEAIIEKMDSHIAHLDQEGFFKHPREKELIKRITPIFFDPELRAQLYKPIKTGVALLKKCKNKGHRVYLLSNIDTEIMPLLQEKHPEIFELFDGIVMSADVGMLKPDTNIYNHTLHKFSLDPAACYFIDDQKENIQGALNAGIHGVHFDLTKPRPAMRELVDLGVIDAPRRHVNRIPKLA